MNYAQTVACLQEKLRVDASFDMMSRRITVGHRPATIFLWTG